MKNCLLLGAGSDTGLAIAHRFAKEGYDLFLAARNAGQYYNDLAADLQIRYKINARVFSFDGSDFASHPDFYKNLPARPDLVISVFGYLGTDEKANADFQEAARIIDSNFTGHVSILNLVAAEMEKRKSGTIIGISSVAGERGKAQNAVYSAAKSGFTAYLSALRNRLYTSSVHVLTVKPGYIKTKMTEGLNLPAPLLASPEQVAEKIWRAFRRKKNVLYVLPSWRLIMFCIKMIPEGIFKKMKLG